MGSDLEGDVGTMTDYTSIQMDRNGPFTVFHYPLSTLSKKLRKKILVPFSPVRLQPSTIPMSTGDLTPSDGATISPLPPVTTLDWSFVNTLAP